MMCEGFNIRFRREYEMYLNSLRVTRWVGSLIYNTNVKSSSRKSPEKLLSLPELETKKKVKIYPTAEEMAEIKKWQMN